jgi:hypothetical protein
LQVAERVFVGKVEREVVELGGAAVGHPRHLREWLDRRAAVLEKATVHWGPKSKK